MFPAPHQLPDPVDDRQVPVDSRPEKSEPVCGALIREMESTDPTILEHLEERSDYPCPERRMNVLKYDYGMYEIEGTQVAAKKVVRLVERCIFDLAFLTIAFGMNEHLCGNIDSGNFAAPG